MTIAASNTEKRRHPRYLLENSSATLQPESNGTHPATFIDISAGGAGILSAAQLPLNERILLSAKLCPTKPPLTAEASIKWASSFDQQIHYGLEFTNTDAEFVKEYLRDVHIANVESFIGCSLPKTIKEKHINDWVHKKYDLDGISKTIDFEKPFLKIEKVVVFDSFEEGKIVQKKSLSFGKLYESDVKGHYNNTIFLAVCGQLMGQAASILVASLNPDAAPQIVQVKDVKPSMTCNQSTWKLRAEGSPFFIEVEITKHRLSLYVTNTKILFGNIELGSTTGMKLFLIPKHSIWDARILPQWPE